MVKIAYMQIVRLLLLSIGRCVIEQMIITAQLFTSYDEKATPSTLRNCFSLHKHPRTNAWATDCEQ